MATVTRTSTCNTQNDGKRNWSQLTAKEMDKIIAVYESGDHHAFIQVAKGLGTTVETLGRQVRSTKMIRDRYRNQLAVEAIPDSPSPICDDFIVRDTENAIVISDIEIPDHDSWMMKAALLVGQRFDIKHIILAGDTIAGDQIGLSTHPVSFITGDEDPFDVVINLSRGVLKAYSEWFDTIDLITGNHDERPAKATQGQIQLHQFFKDLPVTFSQYSYMYLHFPSTDEYAYICHQYNYSKQSVNLAQQIWTVESAPDGSKRKMHVVIGHTHVEQTGWSADGEWRCLSMGCMRDPKRTKYARLRATKFPNL
jgi:predicted phosphodiesterase